MLGEEGGEEPGPMICTEGPDKGFSVIDDQIMFLNKYETVLFSEHEW